MSDQNYPERLSNFVSGLSSPDSKGTKSYERRLRNFFRPLIFKYRVAKEIKNQTDRYLASDFNVIKIIEPDENKISDLIALFLRPDGGHGQGRRFFDLFIGCLRAHKKDGKMLSDLGTDFLNRCNVEVIREKGTIQNRRIDIFMRLYADSEEYFIGIENKLTAEEQDCQLEDYAKDLISRASKYLLIYLDLQGRKPRSLENPEKLEEDGRFACLDYDNFLKSWLLCCYKECEAEKIRWFIKDFIDWIDEQAKE